MVTDFHGVWGWRMAPWPTVHLYTDGSWVDTDREVASAWAVCIRSDWLLKYHGQVEPEGRLSLESKAKTRVFGGRIDGGVGSGNFDAELTAVARGLMSVPVGTSLLIHTDSMSSIQSITRYAGLSNNPRQRLRMSGRPFLALIHLSMKEKHEAGAEVDLRWVRAHSSGADIEHVGNRLADDYATRVRDPNRVVQFRCFRDLPLELHEAFVAIRVGGKQGRVLTGDPRRELQSVLHQESLVLWKQSNTQSMFRSSAKSCAKLFNAVRRRRPHLCGLMMAMVADTVQFIDCDPTNVVPRPCSHCPPPAEDTISHTYSCPTRRPALRDGADRVAAQLRPYSPHQIDRWSTIPDRSLSSLLHSIRLSSKDASATVAACFGAFDDSRFRSADLDDDQRSAAIELARLSLFDIAVSTVEGL